MTIGAGINVSEKKLVALGNVVLTDVHDNVFLTTAPADGFHMNGAFIGIDSDRVGSRRVFPIGKLQYVSLSFFLHSC